MLINVYFFLKVKTKKSILKMPDKREEYRQMVQQCKEQEEEIREADRKKMMEEIEKLKKEMEEAQKKKEKELKRLEEEKKKEEEELKKEEEEKQKYEEQKKLHKAIEVEIQMMDLKCKEQKREEEREKQRKKNIAENEGTSAKIYEAMQKNSSDFAAKDQKAQDCLDALNIHLGRPQKADETARAALLLWGDKLVKLESELQSENEESEKISLIITVIRDTISWNIEKNEKELHEEQKKLEEEERLRGLKKGPRKKITPEDKIAEEERLRGLKKGPRKKITPEDRIAEEKKRQEELERLRALKKGQREKLTRSQKDTEEESRAVAAGLQIEGDLAKLVSEKSEKIRKNEADRKRKDIEFPSPPHESPVRKTLKFTPRVQEADGTGIPPIRPKPTTVNSTESTACSPRETVEGIMAET
jgi:hypothetical protein